MAQQPTSDSRVGHYSYDAWLEEAEMADLGENFQITISASPPAHQP
jgi:hypothetical protein